MKAVFDEGTLSEIQGEYAKVQSFLEQAPRLKQLRDEARDMLGPTPRDEVYREHSTTLYRYRRDTPATQATPILVVPSLVNRPWIMDLIEGESFIAAMLERGFEVFMIEWGEPNPAQRRVPLAQYVDKYLSRAVRRSLKAAGAARLTLAGYCLGGLFSVLHTALDGGQRVRNLVTMVTPVDFQDRGLLSWWAREDHFDVDKIVDTYGNVPADFFSSAFPWLVPTGQLRKVRTVFQKHQDEEFLKRFLALDIWLTENIPFPGEAYRELIKKGYQGNVLVEDGAWDLGDKVARLEDVTVPVLALAARFDHVAPVESCTRLAEMVASEDVTGEAYDTGHLGLALGKTARGAPTTEYWDRISAWLIERDG